MSTVWSTPLHKAKKGGITARDICLIGLMVAVIEACKLAMSSLPNIELTSFWLILFTRSFGKRSLFVIPVFILIEGAIYGFGLWWVMYLYTWPILAIVVLLLRKVDSPLIWALVSGVFGLLFGFFGALSYVVVNTVNGGLMNGLRSAFAWWVAGIPWDLIHGAGNFALMLILYRPLTNVMRRIKAKFF